MSNDIISVEEQAVVMANEFANTIQLVTPADKMRVLRALNSAVSLNSIGSNPIDVIDIIQRPGIRRSRDSRLPDAPCINTYFITRDGKTYMTQSVGISNSARDIVDPMMFPDCGRSTEKGCITLQVIEQKLDNGNTIKSIVPID